MDDRTGLDPNRDLSVEARVSRTAARIQADAAKAGLPKELPLPAQVALSSDGSIVKDVVKAGTGWRIPKDLDSVCARLRRVDEGDAWVALNDLVLDSASNDAALQHVELAIKTMKVNELARVTSRTLAESNFEVELVAVKQREETWNMAPSEKVEEARHRRALGSAAFRAGDLDRSLRRYGESLRYLKLTAKFAGDDETNAHSELVLLHANCAAIHLRRGKLDDAVKQCTLALLIEPAHAKSLFRRGSAHVKLGAWDDAETDFAAALAVDPQNRAVRAEAAKLKQLRREQKRKERKIFGGKLLASPVAALSPSSSSSAATTRAARRAALAATVEFRYAQQREGEPAGLVDGLRRGVGAAAHEASSAIAQLSPRSLSSVGSIGIGALRALVVLIDQLALGSVASAAGIDWLRAGGAGGAGGAGAAAGERTPSAIARSVSGVGGGVALGLRALARGAELGLRALHTGATGASVSGAALPEGETRRSAFRSTLGALLGAVSLLCHTSSGALTCASAVGRGVAVSLGAGQATAAAAQSVKQQRAAGEKAKRRAWGGALLLCIAAAGAARLTR